MRVVPCRYRVCIACPRFSKLFLFSLFFFSLSPFFFLFLSFRARNNRTRARASICVASPSSSPSPPLVNRAAPRLYFRVLLTNAWRANVIKWFPRNLSFGLAIFETRDPRSRQRSFSFRFVSIRFELGKRGRRGYDTKRNFVQFDESFFFLSFFFFFWKGQFVNSFFWKTFNSLGTWF